MTLRSGAAELRFIPCARAQTAPAVIEDRGGDLQPNPCRSCYTAQLPQPWTPLMLTLALLAAGNLLLAGIFSVVAVLAD